VRDRHLKSHENRDNLEIFVQTLCVANAFTRKACAERVDAVPLSFRLAKRSRSRRLVPISGSGQGVENKTSCAKTTP